MIRVRPCNITPSVQVGSPTIYYNYCRDWAISPDLVQGIDYSAKHYAGVAQTAANNILTDTGFIAVSENLTNINAVADDLTNIDTVANNTTDINYVADIGTDISTLADISLDITAVNNNATNINACASNASNINTVAGGIANINTVAGGIANINTVAGISGNITTVAGISTDVTSVASISSAVSAVNTNASNINAVSNDLTNINSVASDLTNIDSVVGMSSAITTVNSNSTNINTCATNIGNINTCAANISTIADKVSKSGDTMTGDLSIRNTQPKIFYYDNAFNIFGAVYGGYASSSIKVITLVAGAASSGSSGAYLNLRYDTSTLKDGVTASTGVKQSITNWAYPSTTYTDLSSHWGADGFTVTAPANGYCYLSIENSGNAFALLNNTTKGLAQICSNPSTIGIFVIVPATKGDVIMVNYNTTSTLNTFKFIHAIGG